MWGIRTPKENLIISIPIFFALLKITNRNGITNTNDPWFTKVAMENKSPALRTLLLLLLSKYKYYEARKKMT